MTEIKETAPRLSLSSDFTNMLLRLLAVAISAALDALARLLRSMYRAVDGIDASPEQTR